jgi:uncharacterized damage-inducible protein DinB
MNPRIKYVVNLYNVNQALTMKALGDAKDTDLNDRPHDKANSFAWTFGHITASRFGLAQAFGLNVEFDPNKLYERGAEITDQSAYPTVDEIKTAFDDISEKLQTLFEGLNDADLDGEPPFTVPGVEETAGGVLAFLSLHESYHVGQLAYINRLHDATQLVG